MKYVLWLICLISIGLFLIHDNFPEWSHQVIDCSRGDYFVIENNDRAENATFWIEGALTQDASIYWTDKEPAPDSTFKSTRQIKISRGKDISLIVGPENYHGNKMFIKYIPSKPTTSGNLSIKVVISGISP